jgi:acrylyl-CoA reductase (NADPH)
VWSWITRLVKAADHVVVTGCTLSETHNGGYSEYLRVPAEWVTVIPESLTLEDAATYGTAGVTAARAVLRLEEAGVRPQDGPIAVPGASGGAGGFVVAMLAGLGYEVHAFSGKPRARAKLLSYGAAAVQPRPDVASPASPFRTASGPGRLTPSAGIRWRG